MPEIPMEKLQITDEDMVPLELLDEVISKARQKFERKKSHWNALTKQLTDDVKKKLSASE